MDVTVTAAKRFLFVDFIILTKIKIDISKSFWLQNQKGVTVVLRKNLAFICLFYFGLLLEPVY